MKNSTVVSELHNSAPKYFHLAESLREQIRSGHLVPGDRLPSFVAMKQRHGATQSTAEKALDLLERDGLIIRRPGSGIFVAERTSTGRASRRAESTHGLIGISGAGFNFEANASYWASILRGIRRAADAAGANVLLLDHTSNRGWEKADGVLICDWTAHEILGRIAPEQPCVSLLVDVPGRASVLPDDRQGAYLATKHLLGLGHTKIAYLHGGQSTIPRRVAGYCEALCEAGIVPDGRWTRVLSGEYFDSSDFEERGYAHMKAWLAEGWREFGCTAILAHNDATAVGVIEALNEAGLSVPNDISVIGFDGAGNGKRGAGAVSTVRLPLEEIGARGVEVLLRQIASDRTGDSHEVLPVTLLERGTTAVPRPV